MDISVMHSMYNRGQKGVVQRNAKWVLLALKDVARCSAMAWYISSQSLPILFLGVGHLWRCSATLLHWLSRHSVPEANVKDPSTTETSDENQSCILATWTVPVHLLGNLLCSKSKLLRLSFTSFKHWWPPWCSFATMPRILRKTPGHPAWSPALRSASRANHAKSSQNVKCEFKSKSSLGGAFRIRKQAPCKYTLDGS